MKTLRREIEEIFEKVEITSSCHQKFSIKLNEIYKKTSQEEFLKVLLDLIYFIVRQSQDNTNYIKRTLNFVSRFCGDITKKEEKEGENHDFLSAVIEKTLQWTTLDVYDIRYNSCYFIAMLLQDIGEEIQLEINLIDLIQQVMLERMKETKIPIRLIAMSALVRLQDPQNYECPVIQAYIEALSSGSAQIRKEATDRIAPNRISISKIKDRIRDSDASVRLAAFHKCADIGPATFRIVDKQIILICGFNEIDKKVKDTFLEYLLPKWLTVYKGNYLKFIGALKLSADDEDIDKMTYLSRELIKEFYSKHLLDDLIAILPINEEKLINIENLTNDVTLFWNILASLLREANDTDEFLDRILPDVSPFCLYIDKIIKAKSCEKMDEWRFLDYQFDLLNLFEIAENYDFSDEVGRRNMYSLIIRTLQDNHFTNKLTNKLISIAQKCSSNLDFFTNDMCNLISEIKEPLIVEPVTEKQKGEREFKAATLKVKINVLEDRQSQAISDRNYKQAQEIEDELFKIRKQLEELQNQNVEKVRVNKSDNDTLCHCLDILANVLKLAELSKLTPSLISCKDNFIIPLICNQDIEIHWRVLKCLALFSVIDKATAEEYAKLICYPIATYRTIPISNVSALLLSINSVTDLISLYGVEIISDGEEISNLEGGGRRKLYSKDTEEDTSKVDNMTLSYIFDVFLDMLDDERDEIRHKAILAICALVTQQFPLTSSIFSRLLLKWYNPLTEKQDNRLQIYLGRLIELYIRTKGSESILRDAIIPTITSIARAPKDSPLADIDVDNVLMFLSHIMNIRLEKDDRKILSLDICMKISENPSDRIVPVFTKFLYHLDLQANPDSTNELMNRVENILENLPDKNSRRYTEKLIFKLRQHSISLQSNTMTDITEKTDNIDISSENNDKEEENTGRVLQEINQNEENTKKPTQVKRRKNRSNKQECLVVLEKLDVESVQKRLEETTLHTIIETSMEMEIGNLSTESISDSSKNSTRSNVIVQASDTSDNDSETRRKSTRIKKKRIIHNV